MKEINYSLIILLILSFAIRLSMGYLTGGAESDAGGYTTYAIQMVQEENYSGIFNPHAGRVIFHLWLFILVVMMKIFGTTNMVAIFTTALLGTISIYGFYRLVNNIWNSKISLLIAGLLALNPTHINISHNAFYDALMVSLILFSIDFYTRYIKTLNVRYLLLCSIIGTLMASVHATGYIYIFILWVLFPFLYQGDKKIKYWLTFSLLIGLLPVVQMSLWKIYVGSYFPYQQLQYNQRFLHQFKDYIFEFRHYIRYFIYLGFSYSPLIFLSLWMFIFDNQWEKDKYKILIFITILLSFIISFSLGIEKDYLSILTIIFAISYVIALKRHLLNYNPIIVICGMFAIIIFTLYLRIFPRTGFGPRQYIYPVIFLLPVLWYYFEKYVQKTPFIFTFILISYLSIGSGAYYFNMEKNKNISPPGFNVTYAKILTPSLPYYIRNSDEVLILDWLKKQDINSNNYILTNLRGNYISSNLNMPQNHFLSMTGLNYSHQNGFEIRDSKYYINWLEKNNVEYIILDKILYNFEYDNISSDGLRKINVTYNDFVKLINKNYFLINNMGDNIVFYKKLL